MTVDELRDWLKDFDDDMEVRIGCRQSIGCDFAYEIATIEKAGFNSFEYEDDDGNCVVLIEGWQEGTFGAPYEEEDDDCAEEDDGEDDGLHPWTWSGQYL